MKAAQQVLPYDNYFQSDQYEKIRRAAISITIFLKLNLHFKKNRFLYKR